MVCRCSSPHPQAIFFAGAFFFAAAFFFGAAFFLTTVFFFGSAAASASVVFAAVLPVVFAAVLRPQRFVPRSGATASSAWHSSSVSEFGSRSFGILPFFLPSVMYGP